MRLKRLPKWALPLVILAISILLAAMLMGTKSEAPQKEKIEKAWLVETNLIAFDNHHPQISILGIVESPYETQMTAAITADVQTLLVGEGQFVEAGEVLVELNDQEAKLIFDQRVADVNDLKAQLKAEYNRYEADKKALVQEEKLLDIANKSLERQAKLSQSNLVARERYETAQSQLAQQALSIVNRELNIADHPNRVAQLKAKLKRSETALVDAQLDLDRTQVRAPFSGQITDISVSPGDRVREGAQIIGLFDAKNIEIRAQIPERFVGTIQEAFKYENSIFSRGKIYGQTVPLELVRLSGRVNSGSGGVDAFFKTTVSSTQLSLGSTVNLVVNLPTVEQVVSVPLSAIYGTDRLYLVENDRLKSLTVQVIGKQFDGGEGDRALVKMDAAFANLPYITTQLPNAISGLKVRLKDEA